MMLIIRGLSSIKKQTQDIKKYTITNSFTKGIFLTIPQQRFENEEPNEEKEDFKKEYKNNSRKS
ncbi:MAG TPA: hypothetical protein VN703_00005 [Candidatus Sulfopaludibacter sp.]|nr:hypothetical protein [Candidatus Sulfopaludibacter sp.]